MAFAVFCSCALTHSSELEQAKPVTSQEVATTASRQDCAPGRGEPAPIRFEDIVAQSGINFKLENGVSPQRYSIETMLGGVAVFDYNNDGLLDIFLTNGAAIPSLQKTGPQYWNRLYRNNGDGTFTDVTVQAGVQGVGYSMGVAAGDYDNDGFVDLYVTGVNRNQLLHNNGDGTFTDVTEKAGVSGRIPGYGKPWAVAAGWFDANHTGRLDLMVINYLDYDIATAKLCSIGEARTYCAPGNFKGTPNILYKNNGNGTFTDVSAASHVGQYIGKGMGLAFGDFDGDGYTDVFVSNDTSPNFLLRNNGDGTFKDVALEQGVAYTSNGSMVAGMGAEFRDLNDDGLPDIFHTAMFGDTFPLYKNTGTQFDDVTDMAGGTALSRRLTAWGTGAFDFDNDGRKDLFVAGGAILDNELEVLHRPALLPNGVWRNMGNFKFCDASAGAGDAILAAKMHRGAAFGSLNNNGKIDVAVNVLHEKPQILMNRGGNGNHWIILNLLGTKDNRDGLGTKVKITTAEGTQYNVATTAVGYSSSSDKRVHFGLGKAETIDRIELEWPTGVKQVLTNVKADQVLTVTESAGGAASERTSLDRPSRPLVRRRLKRFLNLEDLVHSGVVDALHDSAWPADFHMVQLGIGTETEVRAAIAGRHETDAGCNMIVEVPSGAGSHFDLCSNAVAIALAAPQVEHDPMVLDQRVVYQNTRLLAKRGHNQVHEAVIVQVDKGGTALVSYKREVRSHLPGNVHESLAAGVLKHCVMLLGCGTQIVYVAIRGVDIFPAVIVVVHKPDAPAGEISAQGSELRGPGHIAERLTVLVLENSEDLSRKIVIDNIHPSIVVEVLCVRAHARYSITSIIVSHAILKAAFFECSVSLVDEKKIRFCVVGDEDIHEVVPGEIRYRYAHSFTQGLTDAAGFGYIFEAAIPEIAI